MDLIRHLIDVSLLVTLLLPVNTAFVCLFGLKASCNGIKIDAYTKMHNKLQEELVLSMWCDLSFSYQVEVRFKVQVELEATLLSQAVSLTGLTGCQVFCFTSLFRSNVSAYSKSIILISSYVSNTNHILKY